jgi:DNA-binding NtrC family response regulator
MNRATQTLVARHLLRSDGQGGLVVRRCALVVGRRSHPLTGPVVVGSSREADLRVDSPVVSRKHLRLTPSSRGLVVTDLDSKNGTFVREVRITEVLLEHSSVLRLGTLEVQLVVEDERVVTRPETSFGALTGESPAMRALFGNLTLVAQADSPVLLLGESGTGKSEAARAIHEHSPRQRGPFVVLDCGALSEELADSDLFGHMRGAFTGADRDRQGVFVRAQGGTLHLEDVGSLARSLQPRLLRALESHSVQPVGGSERQLFDVRIIASAGPRLRSSGFRDDLYYRLAVVELTLPPLRERPGDVERLAAHFADQRSRPLPPGFASRLEGHAWPGNVRELKNVVDRSLALGEPGVLETVAAGGTEEAERARIEHALKSCAWNQSAAAKLLGISRGTLISRIEKYRLPRPRAR